MRILTAAQMKQAEAEAVANGTSYEQLMENAGTASAQAIERLAAGQAAKKTILLLCGKGNNAGDAFVVARLLAAKGWQTGLLLLYGAGLSPLAQLNLGRVPPAVAHTGVEDANWQAAVLVDGVFGTGFHGDLPVPAAAALARANAAGGLRIALDVPSGLDCDSGAAAQHTFRAQHTLTFGAYKPALVMPATTPYTGQVECLDIGL